MSVLFALFSLAGVSPPASKRTKIPRKSKAVRCEAVLREQKCPQTMKSPQRILCVFSRALRKYEGISAPPNRGCPCQSTQGVPANASAAAFVGRGGAAERARPAARGGARDAQLAPTKGRPPRSAVQQALIGRKFTTQKLKNPGNTPFPGFSYTLFV